VSDSDTFFVSLSYTKPGRFKIIRTMRSFLTFGLCLITQIVFSQHFTTRDSLQGGLPFERICFDVLYYDLNITVNPEEKHISGVNHISFRVIEDTKRIQLDLFENMKIDSIVPHDSSYKPLSYKRSYDAVFIDFPKALKKGEEHTVLFYYSGKPKEAKKG